MYCVLDGSIPFDIKQHVIRERLDEETSKRTSSLLDRSLRVGNGLLERLPLVIRLIKLSLAVLLGVVVR